MAVNRADVLDQNFRRLVAELPAGPRPADLSAPVQAGSGLPARLAIEVFESMISSRHLDYTARAMRAKNQGFYTIGSSGHEGNAAVAAALRPTDMAFLHYRSGAFFVQRARQVPGSTPLLDVLLGLASAADEPIAGGRHKVFGSRDLWIPPQTSTIASHLPKAVGAAFALGRANRLGLDVAIPRDSVIVVSFGDASANHATACTAFNAAGISAFQNLPCPVLFVCEDNGLGISVRTSEDWIQARFQAAPGIRYFRGDGLDLPSAYDAAAAATDFVRTQRRPAFLHLSLVRLLGHAGSDVEMSYRSAEEIAATEARDPLLAAARLLVAHGWLGPDEVIALYDEIRARVHALSEEAIRRPRLSSVARIVAPLAPLDPLAIAAEATRPPPALARRAFHGRLPEEEGPKHLAVNINRALGDLLLKNPDLFLFGEDVARKGGVYHVTADLWRKAGLARVFNTPLDETSILGLAMGFGHLGLLAMPEIQYLAYLHNAIDQLRGEACSLQFFSSDQFRNPMVVRVASLAYQKGFGGHFHNDNATSALREIPALLLAVPSNGRDAVGMLRTLVAAARCDGRVSAFLEPIALYMTRDLYATGDGLWSFPYPEADFHVPVGRARVWDAYGQDRADLTVATYGNGTWMSLRVARKLREERGIQVRVVDLRWLKPLPLEDLVAEASATGRVLVVDECREHGGPGDAVVANLVERVPGVRCARVMGLDTFIPLGDAANLVLVAEADIEAAALRLLEVPCDYPTESSSRAKSSRGRCAPEAHAAISGGERGPPDRGVADVGEASSPTKKKRSAGIGATLDSVSGGARTAKRALVVCPGRGSYGRDSLGSLAGLRSPSVDALDALRAGLGRTTVRALDALAAFSARSHVAGENASILTAGVTLADLDQLDPDRIEVVAVVGNSLGWYTALGVAGALSLPDCGRLIETLGHYQVDNVIGGQLLYPVMDDAWRPDPARAAAVSALLETVPDLALSIRLGGQAVLGGTDAALALATARLPPVVVGTNSFPMRLPLHSAFHTPLMAATRARAEIDLADLGWQAPRLPLVDGAGRVWRPRIGDPEGIRAYTLGAQIVSPFDFGLAVRTALCEYGPDVVVLPGPGSNLGGAIAATMIALGWAGMRSREDFLARQAADPILLSLRWPAQRALAVRA